MQNLLEAMEKLGITFQDEAARAAGVRVAALGMDAQLDVRRLWVSLLSMTHKLTRRGVRSRNVDRF